MFHRVFRGAELSGERGEDLLEHLGQATSDLVHAGEAKSLVAQLLLSPRGDASEGLEQSWNIPSRQSVLEPKQADG